VEDYTREPTLEELEAMQGKQERREATARARRAERERWREQWRENRVRRGEPADQQALEAHEAWLKEQYRKYGITKLKYPRRYTRQSSTSEAIGEAAGGAMGKAYGLVRSEEVEYIDNYEYNDDY